MLFHLSFDVLQKTLLWHSLASVLPGEDEFRSSGLPASRAATVNTS